jgi:hypothetical protein
MAHYTGSADGTDSWVGGQRSAIRVFNNLGPQLKPNGWAGEKPFAGEFPLKAQHDKPVVTVTNPVRSNAGRFVDLNVTVDTHNVGVSLTGLWVASTSTLATTPPSQNQWQAIDFTPANPLVLTHVRVAGNFGGARKYWFFAQDSSGIQSTPVNVSF